MSARLARCLGDRHGIDATRAVRHQPLDHQSYHHTDPTVRAAYDDGFAWWEEYTRERAIERSL